MQRCEARPRLGGGIPVYHLYSWRRPARRRVSLHTVHFTVVDRHLRVRPYTHASPGPRKRVGGWVGVHDQRQRETCRRSTVAFQTRAAIEVAHILSGGSSLGGLHVSIPAAVFKRISWFNAQA